MAEGTLIAGIDIGGTKISALLAGDDGTVRSRGAVAAPASQGADAMADAAASLVRRLVRDAEADVTVVGVGTAGVVDHHSGAIRAASGTFPGWAGYPLAQELSARLDLPICVENDVNAFLLGEVAAGAEYGDDVLGVMLGTGVGGAVLLDGRLRHGPHGAAGEIGHTPGYGDTRCTCGQRGHLETVASGTSLSRRYAERTRGAALGAREVARRARSGDADARAVFDDAGRALALACASAAGILDLPVAVVGGGVAQAWDLLEPAIERTLVTDSPVSGAGLRIVRGRLGEDAVAWGAVRLARGRGVDDTPAEGGTR
ncbi:ROK family protein [Microbacterium luticocti]|uniref:ROK family protein n=1 Tax=Microbacterium luticocti TaxID=451764 RepID=UPI00041997F4|nr:ROK family protein [Microbacterium luticocti]